MSLVSNWFDKGTSVHDDLLAETSTNNLETLDEEKIKKLLFQSIRAGEVHAIKNILKFNQLLLNEKLFGFEGADVYGINPTSKTRRCYTYTGIEKDGYFYPLHIAAESVILQLNQLTRS